MIFWNLLLISTASVSATVESLASAKLAIFQIKSLDGRTWKVNSTTGGISLNYGTDFQIAVLNDKQVNKNSHGYIALMRVDQNSFVGIDDKKFALQGTEKNMFLQFVPFASYNNHVSWYFNKLSDGSCAIKNDLNGGQYVGYDPVRDRVLTVPPTDSLVQRWTCPPTGVNATAQSDLPFSMKSIGSTFQLKSTDGKPWKVNELGVLKLNSGSVLNLAVLNESSVYKNGMGFIGLVNTAGNTFIGTASTSLNSLEFKVRDINFGWYFYKLQDGNCAIKTDNNNGQYVGYDSDKDLLVTVASDSPLVRKWSCPSTGIAAEMPRDLPFAMRPTISAPFQLKSTNGKPWKYNAALKQFKLNSGNDFKIEIFNDSNVYKATSGFVGLKISATTSFLTLTNTTLNGKQQNWMVQSNFIPKSLLSGWYFYKLNNGNCSIRNDLNRGQYVGYDSVKDLIKVMDPTDMNVVEWSCPPAGLAAVAPKDLPFFMKNDYF